MFLGPFLLIPGKPELRPRTGGLLAGCSKDLPRREMKINDEREMIGSELGEIRLHDPGLPNFDPIARKRFIERHDGKISWKRAKTLMGDRHLRESVASERSVGQRISPVVEVADDE